MGKWLQIASQIWPFIVVLRLASSRIRKIFYYGFNFQLATDWKSIEMAYSMDHAFATGTRGWRLNTIES